MRELGGIFERSGAERLERPIAQGISRMFQEICSAHLL
jgi:hypothetical protein